MKKTLLALTAASALFATAAQAQSATYAIEPTHTFVTFEIDHFGTSTNRGRFDKKEGTVQFDRAGKTGKVDITIDVDSVNTGTGPFNSHLKSAEILNVAAYPTARFVGDKFVFEGDKVKSGQIIAEMFLSEAGEVTSTDDWKTVTFTADT